MASLTEVFETLSEKDTKHVYHMRIGQNTKYVRTVLKREDVIATLRKTPLRSVFDRRCEPSSWLWWFARVMFGAFSSLRYTSSSMGENLGFPPPPPPFLPLPPPPPKINDQNQRSTCNATSEHITTNLKISRLLLVALFCYLIKCHFHLKRVRIDREILGKAWHLAHSGMQGGIPPWKSRLFCWWAETSTFPVACGFFEGFPIYALQQKAFGHHLDKKRPFLAVVPPAPPPRGPLLFSHTTPDRRDAHHHSC